MLRRNALCKMVLSAAVFACAPSAWAIDAIGLGGSDFARGPQYLQETIPASTPNAADTGTAEPTMLGVVVADVKGMVQVSPGAGKPFVKATKGMRLTEGATFRTGVRSNVTCIIGDKQTFTVESLSTLTVLEAAKQGSKVKTDLVMKYGATSYGIEAGGAEYDGKIHTPSSTLAVRGTVVRVVDQAGFAPTAESFTGRAVFRNAQRVASLGGRQYATVEGTGSAAQTALNQSVVDPSLAGARTTSESRYIADQVSRGAVFRFDAQANIPVVRNGPGPVADADLANSLPGRLSFSLRWNGNADLNMLLDNQPGDQIGILTSTSGFQPSEILFPGFGLNTSRSGGKIPYDDRGGPRGGMEIGSWEGDFPIGVYGIGVIHASGAETDFTLNAFLDKKPLNLFYTQGVDADGEPKGVKSTQYSGTIGRDGVDAVILFAPGNETIDSITDDADPNFVDDSALRTLARRLAAQQTAKAMGPHAKPTTATPQKAPQRVAGNTAISTPGNAIKADLKAKNLGAKAVQGK